MVVAGVALVAGMVLGGLTLLQPSMPVGEHRPAENAIGAHLVVAGVVVVGAAAATASTRSLRWSWAPLSTRAGHRMAQTFARARHGVVGVLRCVVVSLLVAFMWYLILRMGMQVTAGLDPTFTLNAWGGPSRLGAFAAHGIDAVLCFGLAALLAHAILVDPPQPGSP
ncbi:hypothetical protein [Occultella gossypii]|uniref:Uncharacterized protein n=1 Tax=Occultella gossypii TaxID=2800820 RepID=A0ABS7S3K5_9MICO|nr:hypothetical protein [Occultella gossypii]MBZ2194927.1 hypothetical protein [Occultella gossypii]